MAGVTLTEFKCFCLNEREGKRKKEGVCLELLALSGGTPLEKTTESKVLSASLNEPLFREHEAWESQSQ